MDDVAKEGHRSAVINRWRRGGRCVGGVYGDFSRGRSAGRTEGVSGRSPRSGKLAVLRGCTPAQGKGHASRLSKRGRPVDQIIQYMRGGRFRLTEMDLGKPCGGRILVVWLSLRLNRKTLTPLRRPIDTSPVARTCQCKSSEGFNCPKWTSGSRAAAGFLFFSRVCNSVAKLGHGEVAALDKDIRHPPWLKYDNVHLLEGFSC